MTTCSYISYSKNAAFELIEIGDAEEIVIGYLGKPIVRETQSEPYTRYSSNLCEEECIERLWFENRMGLLDIEAWSVEIDIEGNVYRKAHWLSP